MLNIQAQSVCVHGDGAEAVMIARNIRYGLEQAGFVMKTLPDICAL